MIRFQLFPDNLLMNERSLRVSDLVISTIDGDVCREYVVSEVTSTQNGHPTQEVRCAGFETLEGALAAAQAVQGGASDLHADKVGLVVEESILARQQGRW